MTRAWRDDLHRGETGSITLWLLGLSVMLLALGGVSVDLWRVFSERRALAGMADAAAAAAATRIDLEAFRSSPSEVRLDIPITGSPPAVDAALASIASQSEARLLSRVPDVVVAPDAVSVTVHGRVDLTLLRMLSGVDGIDIEVTGRATPRGGSP